MKIYRILALAALLSLGSFVCNAASANKNSGERVAEASAQCQSFRALPERDQATRGAKYKTMSDVQFAEAMKTCVTPNWQQRQHYDKLAQAMLGAEVGYSERRGVEVEVETITDTPAPVYYGDRLRNAPRGRNIP